MVEPELEECKKSRQDEIIQYHLNEALWKSSWPQASSKRSHCFQFATSDRWMVLRIREEKGV